MVGCRSLARNAVLMVILYVLCAVVKIVVINVVFSLSHTEKMLPTNISIYLHLLRQRTCKKRDEIYCWKQMEWRVLWFYSYFKYSFFCGFQHTRFAKLIKYIFKTKQYLSSPLKRCNILNDYYYY